MKYNGNDIYGGRLLAGHCEVHPNTPYEYPCPECRNEQDDSQAQYNAYVSYCEVAQREHEQELLEVYIENIKHMDGGGI